uniref:Uncharacterized protein n=1 Tax=Oryza glumipatula TaxID=40148 RepID=A0A0E0AEY8_9ORYZ
MAMRWCYVGKATKIFFAVLALLALIGVVLAFRALLHRAKSRASSSSSACAAADECQPILPDTVPQPSMPSTAATTPPPPHQYPTFPPPDAAMPMPMPQPPPPLQPPPPAIAQPPPAFASPPPPDALVPPPPPPAAPALVTPPPALPSSARTGGAKPNGLLMPPILHLRFRAATLLSEEHDSDGSHLFVCDCAN